MDQKDTFRFKMVVVGDGGIGKVWKERIIVQINLYFPLKNNIKDLPSHKVRFYGIVFPHKSFKNQKISKNRHNLYIYFKAEIITVLCVTGTSLTSYIFSQRVKEPEKWK